jgi:hypothetical protein
LISIISPCKLKREDDIPHNGIDLVYDKYMPISSVMHHVKIRGMRGHTRRSSPISSLHATKLFQQS